MILKQVLTPEAQERLANVALVKTDRARQVETYLINAAQAGKLGGKVTEDQLKDLLQQVIAQQETKTVITRRRNTAFDDDDDDDDDDW
jgi:programmed cell death protein 5